MLPFGIIGTIIPVVTTVAVVPAVTIIAINAILAVLAVALFTPDAIPLAANVVTLPVNGTTVFAVAVALVDT